jgi:hypothetical protein
MEFSEYKRMRDELKVSWQDLWRTLIDDEVRAEGIASEYFPELFTDRGDIIFATRDYKPLSFSEILERHLPQDVVDRINPSPDTGGIRKFIRETITKNQVERRRDPFIEDLSVKKQAQRKKGGRGWLHAGLGIKKAFSK